MITNNQHQNLSPLPQKLETIIKLFEFLSEEEKRETLIHYADQSSKQAPISGESFDIEDIRKDEECTDTVGIHLRIDPNGQTFWRVSLGPKVQTLTKALTTILCRGLEGVHFQQVLDLPHDFIPRIVGSQLVRARSQSIYYVLTRMKGILRAWLAKKRLEVLTSEKN
ncbi:MAG: SufE family protein [Chthoniobacterales bacterium]|nr:SufE family protein [Chthoniobacterales bacterium]